ncbi:hypothetical protein P0L94_06010 [Microbacter sp. GSS18]|nr:hypothetical protein P0L94_06010 [Microbacter sp. GSS18]
MHRDEVIAWVESPLQLVGAAEWAHRAGRAVPIAGRLTAQMGPTGDELLRRGVLFGECTPFVGIPWSLLAGHRHWLVGDGFSGQFRLAAAVLRPRRITFLDDGANVVPFADTLLGDRGYHRPGIAEGRAASVAALFALERVSRLAARGGVDFFTAFDFGDVRRARLHDRGIAVAEHAFAWTRDTAPGAAVTTPRVILGSSRPVDGRMSSDEYVAWVRRIADGGSASYLPHRREPAAQRRAVGAIAGVEVVDTGLPAELVLAGTARALELHTQPSSTTTTLRHVLAGTGSTIHEGAPVARVSRRARAGGA